MFKRIALLNGIAIFFVVVTHSISYCITSYLNVQHTDLAGPISHLEVGKIPYLLFMIFLQSFLFFSVPVFFFVSGFFAAYSAKGSSAISWKTVYNRIKFLIVPYLLWSSIDILQNILTGYVYSPKELILDLLLYGVHGGYYFVPSLCIFYLLSPWIYSLAKSHWKVLLIGAAIIELADNSLIWLKLIGIPVPGLQLLLQFSPAELFTHHMFFFPFGIVLGIYLYKIQNRLVRHQKLLLGIFWASLIPLPIESVMFIRTALDRSYLWPNAFSNFLFSIALILCFLAYYQSPFPFSKILYNFSTHSYGIYLMHFFVLAGIVKILNLYIPWVSNYLLIFVPLLTIIGIMVPLGLMSIVPRIPVRGSYRFLFG